jgi:type II restriction/modification system DNA methylase subunit YeeA
MESSIFGGGGNGIFIDSPYHALGVLNSKIVGLCTKILNPTANILVGDLLRIPYIKDFEGSNSLASDVKKLINIHQIDWNSYETSWGFACLPLLVPEHSQPALKSSYKRLCVHWQTLAEETKRIEEHNNRIFIEAYGLQDELTPDVPIKEITLTCNPVYRYGTGKAENEYEGLQLTDTMKELISYAVGCMMGRYSPDTPGLQFAGGTYNHEKACAAAPSFHPDADGILPVLAEAYFEDDLTARFTEFLKATFGKEHLSENLRFVAEAIGIKGSESPQDAIRRFLANDFFKYHMRMYKKRPIYWLFSSGKEKAFQALVYLHRYTPSTLARMRTGYLHELQNKLRARIEDMEAGKDAATSTAQANRINRELTKLRKQLEELRVFDEKLHHYADQRIELDLDDGVKHNYGLFGDLLAEVKDVTGDKE